MVFIGARNTIRVDIKGTKELERQLRRLGTNAPAALARELFTEASLIMTEADKIVPIDTGALRLSGRVEQPRINGSSVSVQMGFGGPSAAYAFFVHEAVGANFKRPGAQAKFLEKPTKEAARGMAGRIARRLKLKSGKSGLNLPAVR
jgi:hypothetical protein